MIEPQDIPALWREMLEDRGISRDELASRIGSSRSTVSRYIAGLKRPGIDVAARINAALDLVVVPREKLDDA